MFIIVEERPVQPECLPLQDRPIPKRFKQPACFCLTKSLDQLFHQFHIAAVGKYCLKLFISCLEYAEGGIARAVDDLDVFHVPAI